jgi:hypothetical protein
VKIVPVGGILFPHGAFNNLDKTAPSSPALCKKGSKFITDRKTVQASVGRFFSQLRRNGEANGISDLPEDYKSLRQVVARNLMKKPYFLKHGINSRNQELCRQELASPAQLRVYGIGLSTLRHSCSFCGWEIDHSQPEGSVPHLQQKERSWHVECAATATFALEGLP